MGRKYASIHIITNQQDEAVLRLLKYYRQNLDIEKALNAAYMVGNAELIDFTMRRMDLSLIQVIILQTQGLVSVYDENLSFETMEQYVCDISEMTKGPIVYISNFDDDILLFGLICFGEIITSGIIGDGLAIYGLNYVDIDVQKIKATAGIGDEQFYKNVDGSNDIKAVEKEFIRILNVPLKLTVEMIAEKNEYIQTKEQKGVLVIKKSV